MLHLVLTLASAIPTAGVPQRSLLGAESVGFEQALKLAAAHPDVEAARRRLGERARRDDGIGPLATDPRLQVQPGYRIAPPSRSDGLDGRIDLQQRFNLEGWGGARREAARAERVALAHRIRALDRAARRRAAGAWLEAWVQKEALKRRRAMLDEAREIERQTARRFELGMIRKQERVRMRAFVAQARLDVLDAEGRLFERGIALAAACGRGEGPLFAEGTLPSADLPPRVQAMLEVERDPEVQAARAQVEAAERRSEEATAQDGWQVLTGLGVAREPPGDYIPSATLGVTLPVSGRNRRASSERAADRAAAESVESATTLAMRRLRIAALHEVEHTGAVMRLYSSELVPARRDEVRVLTREFEVGAVPLRRVLDARLRLLDAEIASAQAHGRYHAAAFDLALLVRSDEEDRS